MGLENDLPLDSLLVNIRSVVQSSKGGVLLDNLQDDYKKLVGTDIPFKKFGYDSLQTFLQNASNFISIKKNSNGQLSVEAVADSSTVHLANLISKQKSGKGKRDLRASYFKAKSGYKSKKNYSASVCSNSSVTDEKDKEIEEWKNKWEKEKTMNEELTFEVSRLETQLKIANKALQFERNNSSQIKYQQSDTKFVQELTVKLETQIRINKGYFIEVERLSSELKKSEDSLKTERECVQKLKDQLKSLQMPTKDEGHKKEEEISTLLKRIEDLNSKLEEEKKTSRDFSSQAFRLNFLAKMTQDSLAAEQNTVKKLKRQIEALQSSSVKEPFPVFEYLNSTQNGKDKCKSMQNLSSNNSWDDHLNLLETDAAKQLNSCNNLSLNDDQNPLLAVLKSYEEQMTGQMQKFVNQIKKQNQKLMMLQKTQEENYEELREKITYCNESVNVDNIVQKILEHPQFLKSKISGSRGFNVSDSGCQSVRSITPLSSQSDNDSELSFKVGSTSQFRPPSHGNYGPPPATYKVKKGYYEVSYQRSHQY